MPQNAQQVNSALNPAKQAAPMNLDAMGDLLVASGTKSALNISASAVIKATPGRLVRVSVITAGSAAGKVHDCAAVADATTANQIGTIPNTVGTYMFDWPCATGIVYVLGTGQAIAASFI